MFRYMIGFSYFGPNGTCFGNYEIFLPQRISSMTDVNAITDQLRLRGFNSALLLSFSEFATVAPKTPATK